MDIPALRQRLPASTTLISTTIALAAFLLTAWTQWLVPPAYSVFADEWLRDRFVQLQASNSPDPRILIVDIDEASMAALGPWPWPRARIAELVEKLLTTYSARGVALDIVLPQAGDQAGNERLALLARHGPLVLAQAFDFDFQQVRPEPVRDGVLAGATAAYPGGGVAATGFIGNHPDFAQAPHVGNIGFVPDADGVLRRVPLVTSFEGRRYAALSLALINCCAGAGPLALADTGMARVAYRRDWAAYTVVAAADILS
jgi:adenylate cyclase